MPNDNSNGRQPARRTPPRGESVRESEPRKRKKRKGKHRALKIAGGALGVFFALLAIVAFNLSSIASIFGLTDKDFLTDTQLMTKTNDKIRAKSGLYDEYMNYKEVFAEKDVINVLVFGMDKNSARMSQYSAFRPDTIMVVSIDFTDKKITVVSIPRDTYTSINGGAKDKINVCFAYAKDYASGLRSLRKSVQDILGITLHYYVGVDMDGVIDIIDTIGGVEVDVKADVYIDGVRKVKKGLQVLNGRNFMRYARFRDYADGDIARVRVQQQLFKDLFKTVVSPTNVHHATKIVSMVSDMVDTDLELKQMFSLAFALTGFKLENITTATLPGSFGNLKGLSMWIIDQSKLVTFVKNTYGITIPLKPQDPRSDKLQSLTLTVKSTISVGESASLSVSGHHADGSTQTHKVSSCTVTFSNPSIARLSGDQVVGVSAGSTVVTVAKDGVEASATITVKAKDPDPPAPPPDPPVTP